MNSYLAHNKFYRAALSAAEHYLKRPASLLLLVDRAYKKAKKSPANVLADIWQNLSACFRLLKAYARREYVDIQLQKLLMIVAAMLYFLMPLDAMPDFIVNVGLIDDIALLTWTFKSLKSEIEQFLDWESANLSDADLVILAEDGHVEDDV